VKGPSVSNRRENPSPPTLKNTLTSKKISHSTEFGCSHEKAPEPFVRKRKKQQPKPWGEGKELGQILDELDMSTEIRTRGGAREPCQSRRKNPRIGGNARLGALKEKKTERLKKEGSKGAIEPGTRAGAPKHDISKNAQKGLYGWSRRRKIVKGPGQQSCSSKGNRKPEKEKEENCMATEMSTPGKGHTSRWKRGGNVKLKKTASRYSQEGKP